MAKRRMSAKQIKFFGTSRQRAALKAKRKPSHRPRTKPRRKNAARKVITGYGSTVMNPGKTNVVFNKGKRSNPVHRRKKRRATKPARKRNLGGIFALSANPAKRSKSMARTRKRKSSNPKHHRRAGSARRNPTRRIHHRRRSNPSIGGMGTPQDWLYGGVGVIAGVVGTRALPQLILGSSNTGIMGYLANAATTALLTFAAHFASKSKVLAASVLAGGAASILSRVIQDYSLLGSYSSTVGLGDYLMSDFLTPQAMTNGLKSANLRQPGWAGGSPSVPINVQGAGAGVSGIYGPALY
jgi:hypothetical protein